MRKFALVISYLGQSYHGWQIQNGEQIHFPTVQGIIEKAIMSAFGQSVQVVGSGRTDQGVSAIGQVAHVELDTNLLGDKIAYVINQYLPSNVHVVKSFEVDEYFHARYSAKLKTYRYHVYLSKIENPYFEQFAVRVTPNLNVGNMMKSTSKFLGKHDFTSFCSVHTEIEDKVREITDFTIKQDGDLLTFEITGNGFLYNMVRIIVGTMISIGAGKLKSSDIDQLFEGKDRTKAGKTMPAKGLVLYQVSYE